MSLYLIFEQTLKKQTPEPIIPENSSNEIVINPKGERVLRFDLGQDLLYEVMLNFRSNNPIISNFSKHFNRTIKKYESKELMEFYKEVKKEFSEGGIEFIHKATDGASLQYPKDFNIEKQFTKNMTDFEYFVKFSIDNQLTIKHVLA